MIYDYVIKIILIGDHFTGKSSFFKKILNLDNFSSGTTIGVDFGTKYKKRNNEIIKINIWDTAGQERFRAIILSYFKGISGVFLFFDLNNKKSFKSIENWLLEIKDKNTCDHDHPIILIGNKNDLKTNVDYEEIKKLVLKYDLIYKQISVINEDVSIILDFMIDIIYSEIIEKNIKCYGARSLYDVNENNNNKIINKNNNLNIKKCC